MIITLYWFSAQKETSTIMHQKLSSFYLKFSVELAYC